MRVGLLAAAGRDGAEEGRAGWPGVRNEEIPLSEGGDCERFSVEEAWSTWRCRVTGERNCMCIRPIVLKMKMGHLKNKMPSFGVPAHLELLFPPLFRSLDRPLRQAFVRTARRKKVLKLNTERFSKKIKVCI